jgi:hypothetical protein
MRLTLLMRISTVKVCGSRYVAYSVVHDAAWNRYSDERPCTVVRFGYAGAPPRFAVRRKRSGALPKLRCGRPFILRLPGKANAGGCRTVSCITEPLAFRQLTCRQTADRQHARDLKEGRRQRRTPDNACQRRVAT